MATKTQEAIVGAVSFFAGATAGGILGRNGFFGGGVTRLNDNSGVITPGGASSADAQATAKAGVQAQAPNPNGAILTPSFGSVTNFAKANPIATAGIALAVLFVAWKLLR